MVELILDAILVTFTFRIALSKVTADEDEKLMSEVAYLGLIHLLHIVANLTNKRYTSEVL